MLESRRIRLLLRLIHPDISTRGACRMAIDVLQDVLDTIRLHGLIAGIHTFAAPWGYATAPDSQDIAFLVMVQGGGILEVEEGDLPVRTFQSGDIVVLPRGTRYMLRDKVHSPT